MKPEKNPRPKQQLSLEDYWNKSERSQDQKFYIAFCLLNTAYFNYAVGAELNNNETHNFNPSINNTKKMDWAATALYYSSIHCGRLACFLALNDFPKGHLELVNCFQKGKTKTVKARGTGIEGLIDKKIQKELEFKIQIEKEFKKESIASYFAHAWKENEFSDVETPEKKLAVWGEVLSQGRELRTYCSYEGLLISNNYNHFTLSQDFRDLCDALLKANEKLIKESTYLFKSFINTSPRREYWYSFLNYEGSSENTLGLYYTKQSLENKVANQLIINKIEEIMFSNLKNSNINSDFANEVKNNIITGAFEGKNQLMIKFRNGVSNFHKYVTSVYQNEA
jgi:hypothetical protein